ncbi:MAG: hypothetical protein GX436_06615 [Synergistaceae bacterium]|nr:hypothetical protein [Synergistaceae bacterium]
MTRTVIRRRGKIRLRRNLNWRIWELLRRGMGRWRNRGIVPRPQPGLNPCGANGTGKP